MGIVQERWKFAVGGACLTGIVGLALADLIVPKAGAYWAAHPMFGGALIGVLFLLLTVLVIDEAINRANVKRWRRAAEPPVAQLIATRDDPLVKQLREQLDAPYAASASGRAARTASRRLQADIAAAPTIMGLLASDTSLHAIFESTWVYVEMTTHLEQACREHATHVDAEQPGENSWKFVQRRWAPFETASLALAKQAKGA